MRTILFLFALLTIAPAAPATHGVWLDVVDLVPVSRDPLFNAHYDLYVTVEDRAGGGGSGTVAAWGTPIWWDYPDFEGTAPVAVPPGGRATVVIPWDSSLERMLLAGEIGPGMFCATAAAPHEPQYQEMCVTYYPIWMPGPPLPS